MKVAADSGNEAGIGNKDLDNGVVILVSMEDKQRFVATGSGIQGTLSDIVTEHLQEKYLVPAFQDGDYEKGLSDLYYGIMDAIQYGVDQGELEAYQKKKIKKSGGSLEWCFSSSYSYSVFSALFFIRSSRNGSF